VEIIAGGGINVMRTVSRAEKVTSASAFSAYFPFLMKR
jgi:hypothetical protein